MLGFGCILCVFFLLYFCSKDINKNDTKIKQKQHTLSSLLHSFLVVFVCFLFVSMFVLLPRKNKNTTQIKQQQSNNKTVPDKTHIVFLAALFFVVFVSWFLELCCFFVFVVSLCFHVVLFFPKICY